MGRMLALAIVMVLGGLAAAEAQPASGSKAGGSNSFGGMGSSTPGGDTSPSVGTRATPGAELQQATPGGAIPMGAATQGASQLPDDPSNFDAGRGSKSR